MSESEIPASLGEYRRALSRLASATEAYTTRTCAECGSIAGPKGQAGLRIREWECGDCGAVHDRDVNAARNILRLGIETLAGGAGFTGGFNSAHPLRARAALSPPAEAEKGSGEAKGSPQDTALKGTS